ncbi:TetR/AcrR family transcriptional regulator [Frigoriglobus tundricola]|uniref:Transcriptional regulator, AcrR family n=1 Tax=Frigoriglobus tundricola TaxID=2774151 RepID=A0A6M5YPV5_9BACT|nr:TetR/AcrR family transcriptional regulator [Frigoriglobus tundricola]QJW95002.1 Transcriptional regulator, AcrR family [Frigoriglobus tundricola]
MSTLTRRQREYADREERLLDEAGRLLVANGFDGLTLDRLAAATDFSKGLMYKHFASKEDLVAALAVRSLRVRLARFVRAAEFKGTSRERILAIEVGEELSFRQNPHHMGSELIVKMGGLETRVADDRRSALHALERECFGIARRVVEGAVRGNDLRLHPPLTPAAIVLSIMATKWGLFSTIQNYRPLLVHQGLTTPLATFRPALHAVLDGFGWRPLASEFDYEESYRRILAELFAEDAIRFGAV